MRITETVYIHTDIGRSHYSSEALFFPISFVIIGSNKELNLSLIITG